MARKTFETLSDSLTPSEVKNKEFGRALYGYSPQLVVEFLDSVSRSWEKVQRRERDLIEEIKNLNDEIDRLKAKEAEVEQIKAKAHEEAERIREQGRQEAERYFLEAKSRSEEIRGKTEEWLTTIITQVEETERRRNSFLTAFKSALDQHYALLNSDLHRNEGLESQLSSFLSAMTQIARSAEAEELPSEIMVDGGKFIS